MGFLTGGRGDNFRALEDTEKNAQREEAYAQATVALTRAQRFCFVMCPLDMQGLVGVFVFWIAILHQSTCSIRCTRIHQHINVFFFAVRCLRATKVAGGALQSAK